MNIAIVSRWPRPRGGSQGRPEALLNRLLNRDRIVTLHRARATPNKWGHAPVICAEAGAHIERVEGVALCVGDSNLDWAHLLDEGVPDPTVVVVVTGELSGRDQRYLGRLRRQGRVVFVVDPSTVGDGLILHASNSMVQERRL